MPRAVVIGAGASRLTAAIHCAARGYEVTVVDRQAHPGGLLARFQRGRARFDVGVHYLGGVGPGHVFGRILRHLGVFGDLAFQPLDPDGFDLLRFPGFEFAVPVGMDAFAERLADRFPAERDGIRRVVARLREAVEGYGIADADGRTDLDIVRTVEGEPLLGLLDRHLRDARLRAVLSAHAPLYGVVPAEAPVGLHAIVLYHFLEGACRVRGGGDALAGALVRRLEALGGRLLLRRRVVGLEVAGRRVDRVVLHDGTELPADLVVTSLHPAQVLDLLSPGVLRPAYAKRVRGQRVGLGHMGIFLELDGVPRSLVRRNLYSFSSLDPTRFLDDMVDQPQPFYFASAAEPAEEGAPWTVVLTTPLGWERVAAWADTTPGRRPEAYRRLKDALATRVLDRFYAENPEIREQVVAVHSSTPLSTAFFTGAPRGAMYGHYHSVDQMGVYRPPQFTRVRGLVQVGQVVFAPGVLGAMLSVYYGLGRLPGFEGLFDEMRRAG